MFDWLREWWQMRQQGLKRVRIVETTKRAEPIEVTKFLDFSTFPDIPPTQSSLDWVVANIRPQSDVKDFWKLASETLADGCGDCFDGSVLLACLTLARNKLISYYKVLVNIFDTPNGFHCVVTVGGELRDWLNPSLKTVPSDWKLWYCFNKKHAYTTKENWLEWKK
jgi:hypothetical protein